MINKTFYRRMWVNLSHNCPNAYPICRETRFYITGVITGGYIASKINQNELKELLSLVDKNECAGGRLEDLFNIFTEWYFTNTGSEQEFTFLNIYYGH